MDCPLCGHSIRGRALFCPNCGSKLVQEPLTPQRSGKNPERKQPVRDGGPKQGCGLSLTVLAIATLCVVAIAGLGVAGVYYGLADRAQAERQAAEEHYQKGLAHLDQERYELAVAEFELAAQLNPEHEEVTGALAQARHELAVQPTPTPALQEETAQAYLRELCEAHAIQDWEKLFDLAERLIALDVTYHREEVDQMLFDAYYATGLQMVEGDRVKEAVRLFDQALTLQPGSAQVAEAKELARLYLEGMTWWNADWARTAENFGALYERAPDYKDVRRKTYEAYMNYGALLEKREQWCSAEEQYARALGIIATFSVAEKRHDAQLLCRGTRVASEEQPTPTAGEQPTKTPLGTFVGGVVEETEVDSSKMFIRGRILGKDERGIQGTRVRIGAWDWRAVAITDGNGQFSFDGLSNPVTYTLTLLDLPSLPFDVAGEWGKIKWVHFLESH